MSMVTSLRNILARHTVAGATDLVVQEEDGALRCLACGHRCLIRDGKAGICRVRFNQGGTLRAPAGYVAALQSDPIEKKPFYHAYPGRNALSFGMLGCDLHCGYCQNWITSQALRDDRASQPIFPLAPDDVVTCALEEGTPVIVSTYNEPLITAEWAVQVFEKAREAGLVCGFVSNGNATPEVLRYLRPWVDLYKVDLKSFQDRNYRKLGCVLRNVLDTILRLKEMGFWVEVVTLVVPGFNDGEEELRDMAQFLAGVSPDLPWHVTAFHPDYKMRDRSRTPADALLRAWEVGREAGLRFVYPGNVPGRLGRLEDTRCPACDAILIERHGFTVMRNRMRGDSCPDCGSAVAGLWEASPPRGDTASRSPRTIPL